MCISQQWLRGGDVRIHVEKRMTQTSVDTVCATLVVPESGDHLAPDGRGWGCSSLYRNDISGSNAARRAEVGLACERRRGGPLPTGRPCQPRDVGAGGRVGKRVVNTPGTAGTADFAACQFHPRLAVRCTVCRRTIAPGDTTPGTPLEMRQMRHRRPDRPSSASRPHEIFMATDTPVQTSDRIELDCDYVPSAGGNTR